MATKSFIKTIDIKNKALGAAFAEALEKTEITKSKEVHLKSNTKELK